MRFWGKIMKNNHLIRDHVAEIDDGDTPTHQILRGLEEICREADVGVPIWLDHNVKEFGRYKKTRFQADHFIEAIDFDYLSFEIIDE